ncbi:hypothetical protein KBY66_03325 [Synechococcus sp. Tobar12-5m-g]|uniref:hypothetical protein n=1 Tax=unclassified Synechococcus TaxID=2626047 RepID=UPI0020CE6AFE|nr:MULTISPECIES: hypothetical protein [unclassified Synechococcus]MCP9771659.1 hypothetical protein [Synechococcus sp. Tobar12-5m-g]MCP9872600.1 hypothetical protein [Synechococcus sp. Cruz CV-v-12]
MTLLQSPIQHRTRLPRAERDAQILRLRAAGQTHLFIANQVGCGEATVQRVVRGHLQALQREIRLDTASIRSQHLLELRWLRERLAPAVARGDTSAVGRWLQVQDREAKLLGLDAPLQIEAAAEQLAAITVLQHLADELPVEVMDQIVEVLAHAPTELRDVESTQD